MPRERIRVRRSVLGNVGQLKAQLPRHAFQLSGAERSRDKTRK